MIRKALFFLCSYPRRLRIHLLLLLLTEPLISAALRKKIFPDFLVESRSILGYLYERGGRVKQLVGGIEVSWIEGGSRLHLFLRWNSSDFLVFEQVLIKKEYGLACEYFQKSGRLPGVIVDAGANIGCSSIYFHNVFPDSALIAIEPAISNIESLKRNLSANQIEKVQFFPIAVWNEEALLSFEQFGDGRDWSYKVGDSKGGEIPARTLAQIFQDADVSQIDILKMDIEGAESVVFGKDGQLPEVLSKVKVLAIEVHSKVDEAKISSLLSLLGFKITRRNETLFAFNQHPHNEIMV